MTDFTQSSLESVLKALRKVTKKRAALLSIQPTKMFIPRYPGETDEGYIKRVEEARRVEQAARRKYLK